jgi:hypothetical protein
LLPVTPCLKYTVVVILPGMLVNTGESSVYVLHCNMLVCNFCSNAIHVLYLPITHGPWKITEFSVTL